MLELSYVLWEIYLIFNLNYKKEYLFKLKANLLNFSLIEAYFERNNVGIYFHFDIVQFLINNYSITNSKFIYH